MTPALPTPCTLRLTIICDQYVRSGLPHVRSPANLNAVTPTPSADPTPSLQQPTGSLVQNSPPTIKSSSAMHLVCFNFSLLRVLLDSFFTPFSLTWLVLISLLVLVVFVLFVTTTCVCECVVHV